MLGFRVKLSLLVFSLLPVLVGLGLWQLSRYQDKKHLEQTYEERRHTPPVALSELNTYPDPLYLPVKATGQFDVSRSFVLDNQIWQGQAGYSLITPFKTDSGRWLLVDRGWVPMMTRDVLPDIRINKKQANKNQGTIQGTIYRTLGSPFLLSEDRWQVGWPKRIQAVDFQRMQTVLDVPIGSYTLVLDEGQPAAKQVRPLRLNMTSDRHLGYAFQWFTMALVLLGLYIYQMHNHKMHEHKVSGNDPRSG